MKAVLSLLVLWLCCIATVSAKMPLWDFLLLPVPGLCIPGSCIPGLWGLPVPGSRAGGNVKTGSASAEDMGDLTNRNRPAGDEDDTTVRGEDGIPPPNTPPS
jgi:hypothetical protein